MARSPKTPRNPEAFAALDNAIQDVLLHGNMQPLIVEARRKPGSRTVQISRPTQIKSIRETIVQIQQDGDPIQFLIDVMRGGLIEVVHVAEEPSDIDPTKNVPVVKSHYEQASIKSRIDVAKTLARMVLPAFSVQQHIVSSQEPEDGDGRLGEPGQPGYAQIVARAASRAKEVQFVVKEPTPEELAEASEWPGSAGHNPGNPFGDPSEDQ